jgi:hypothetical protein
VIFLSDFNFDENTINKLKGMINNGELNDVISQIPPDMIKNFSSIMQNNSSVSNNENASNNSNFSNASENTRNKTNNSGFDFNNIDMNTIMKIKSIMEKMNDKNDPRSNLLNSLKPYLREGRKEKLDQYANLMKVANIAELLKNDDKEKNNNG